MPQVAALCKHGPPRQVLSQVLAALPENEWLDIHEVAELLRCSVRSIKRGVISGDLPKPLLINSLERWNRQWLSQ